MTTAAKARKWAARVLGRVPMPPRGSSLAIDIARLTAVSPTVVFDVGGHIGQTVRQFRSAWPEAHITTFEPGADAFRQLTDAFGQDSRVTCERLALGAESGQANLFVRTDSSSSSTRQGDEMRESVDHIESIELSTLDRYCTERGTGHIDVLKIDTEGSELDVLSGGSALLRENKISFLQVEAGVEAVGKFVALPNLRDALGVHGYALFGIYNQMHEWELKSPRLRRVDAVFVSPEVTLEQRPVSVAQRAQCR